MAGSHRSVAGILRELRRARGQSLRTVASDVGIAASQLSRIERGQRGYDDDLGRRLGEHYDLSPDEVALLGGRAPSDIVEILLRHPQALDELRRKYAAPVESEVTTGVDAALGRRPERQHPR